MKHTARPKPSKQCVTLTEAMDRIPGLTQTQLQEHSGVDRSRISKLKSQADPRVLHDTYEKLDAALRALGALRTSEKLVFGPDPKVQERISA